MQSEQGFAMRPFPQGAQRIDPGGQRQAGACRRSLSQHGHQRGTSAKPGDRVVLTDLKIDQNKIIFDLNGGPDAQAPFHAPHSGGHRRMMNPVVQDDGPDPLGARLTLSSKITSPNSREQSQGAAGAADLL